MNKANRKCSGCHFYNRFENECDYPHKCLFVLSDCKLDEIIKKYTLWFSYSERERLSNELKKDIEELLNLHKIKP